MEFKTEIFFIIPFIISASIIFLIIITRFIIGFCFEDNCPRCESNKSLERKPSSLLNKFIPFVDSKQFFCFTCKKGFYKRKFTKVFSKGKSFNKTNKTNSGKIVDISA
jgi:hypothetical protein